MSAKRYFIIYFHPDERYIQKPDAFHGALQILTLFAVYCAEIRNIWFPEHENVCGYTKNMHGFMLVVSHYLFV